jgi:nucleotide-binding universal stress UspA family protein
MNIIKRILVPVDLGDGSVAGLKYALFLAKWQGAEVVVVHVVDEREIPRSASLSRDARLYLETERVAAETLDDRLIENALEKGRWELSRFLSRHLESRLLHDVREVVCIGKVADEIVAAAAAEECDLIVMASGGKNWMERLVHGSLTEKVVRMSACPVLTIQPFAKVRQDGERVPVELLVLNESPA